MRKIIPIILIVATLAGGIFISPPVVEAAPGGPPCTGMSASGNPIPAGCDTSLPQNPLRPSTSANTKTSNLEAALPICDFNPLPGTGGTNVGACLVELAYHIVISTLTFVLRITAGFFDYMAMLTLHSGIYASQFIHDIWVIVRDFANIFFILILLYAAIELILGIGHNPLRTVAAVIVIALLVNFSLFFTRIVIDASNVMGLLFYNRIDTSNGVDRPISKLGEKGISRSLVERFNINEFFSPTTIDQAKQQTVSGTMVTREPLLSNGMALALITIYAIVIGPLAYAFMIVGLSFLGRAVTLMFLMMIAPLAFVTYAVPGLKSQEFIGFDSWKKKLLSSAFMAAIFMFILYIVSEILKANPFTGSVDKSQGIAAVLIGIFVPAVVIIMLLLKGASYAKKASGAATDAILSGAKVVGGLALGGAALGVATVGRGTVGAFMKGASTGDTSAQRIAAEQARRTAGVANWRDTDLTWLQRAKGHVALRSGFDNFQRNIVGGAINRDQHHIEHAAHARHDLDTTANSITHGRKKKWEELNGEERYEARRQIARETTIRNFAAASTANTLVDPTTGATYGAFGTRGWDKLSTAERNAIDRSAAVGNDPTTNHAIAGGALANQTTEADILIRAARRKQGAISNVMQSTVTGSYDVRGLADVVAKEQSTLVAKLTSGLTGAIVSGMRGGLKSALGVNIGTPQRTFFKDLGNTISEALKSAKINVDLSHVGEEKKESDKGGGHH